MRKCFKCFNRFNIRESLCSLAYFLFKKKYIHLLKTKKFSLVFAGVLHLTNSKKVELLLLLCICGESLEYKENVNDLTMPV